MNSVDESVDNNMVSNLPLLFANGYPTSLDKINESQIQNFIPFMVQCSLGNINVPGKDEYSEPEWWPEDIQFSIPLTKPKKFQGNWLQKMKDIVRICYHFHKSVFLLRFCFDLAGYEHKRLRFINNFNSTTSLYDRRNNKLLVTFRNENMTYDQPQKNRKCLLQQKSRSQNTQQKNMVEPPLFDIYLCDNCDAELYSLEANMEHEKTCVPVRDENDDDDVIFISDNELIESKNISNPTSQNIAIRRDSEFKNDFLKNFSLQDRESIKNPSSQNVIQNQEPSNLTRRNRRIYQLARCVTIPITSPAGQLLTGRAKVTDEYIQERLERIERFCCDKAVAYDNRPGPSSRSKLSKRRASTNVLCTFKKPQDYPVHFYKFPKRTKFSNYHYLSVQFLNKLLYDNYSRPLSVRLHKISESEINKQRHPNSDLKMKIIRQQGQCNLWEITNKKQKPEIVVDTIDLCSSDDEDDANNNGASSSCTTSEENTIIDNSSEINNLNHELDISVKKIYSTKKRRLVIDNINSEITLTPIEKSLDKQYDKEIHLPTTQPPFLSTNNISSSNNINTSSSNNHNNNNNDSNFNLNNNIDKNHMYEGNFLLSPHQEIVPANLHSNISKSLQKSVFLFSNYTTATTNSALITLQQHSNEQQENFLDNIIQQTNDRTLPLITNVTSPSLNNNLNRNVETTKVLQNLNFMQHYVENDTSLNKINSPKSKRAISIDLTL